MSTDRSVDVVLGLTADKPRDARMINNRVFEALASGVLLSSERRPALEPLLGEALRSTASPLNARPDW